MLDPLNRLDRWLLSLSPWQIRQLALLLALLLNLPVAWASFRLPCDGIYAHGLLFPFAL
jgi:hypothetical protein